MWYIARMCILTMALWIGAALAKAPVAAWEPPTALHEEFNRAVAALNEGNPARAEEILTRVVAKAPDCGMALVLLGQARSRQNHAVEAIEVLGHATELFPEQWMAHVALAEAAFGAQDFVVASQASGRGLDLNPGHPGTASVAVLSSLRLGDLVEARARVARTTLSAPDRACLDVGILLEATDIPAARSRLLACDDTAEVSLRTNARSLMAVHTNDNAALYDNAEALGLSGFALAERGGLLLEAGKCAEALPVLDAAMVALPKDVGVRVNRAQCLVNEGRLEDAERAITEVVASDTWVDLHVSGAISGITLKSQEVRLQAIQRQAAVLLIDVQVRRTRTTEAAASLAKARARYGEVVEIVLAEAELVTAQGHAAEGWSLLQAAMTRFPAEPLLAARLAHRAVGDPTGLNAAVVAYVRAQGTLVDRQNLGLAENNGKDWVGCRVDLAAVAAADPTQKRAAENAYVCAVLSKDVDAAFALLGPLGDTAPRDRVHDHALLLQHAKRHTDALSLIKLYPTAEPTMDAAMRRVAITSHLALGQHAEAVALVGKPGLEPKFLAWVGQELVRADRKVDAARVLGEVCPKLTGEDAVTCGQLLETARK